jgi:hypothetical protein
MTESSRVIKTAGGWMGYKVGEEGVSRVFLPLDSREE